MTQDRELLERLTGGDKDALCAIYERHKGMLMTVAASFVGDSGAAEDCLQDVFVALAGGARPRRGSNLRSYLVASVANKARDLLRRKSRRGEAVDIEALPEILARGGGPLAASEARDLAGKAYSLLVRLPYEQREVVTLHLLGELTFAEIARQQRASINTVQSRYRYGMDKLRSLWKDEAPK